MDSKMQNLLTLTGTALITSLLGYFGVVNPSQQKADANRSLNWDARDALKECQAERRELQADFQHHLEGDGH